MNSLVESALSVRRWQKERVRDQQAIKIDPDDADSNYGLGNTYYNTDKYQDAIESYKQAISINPDHAYAHCMLGLTYIILKDRGSALEQYKILKRLDTKQANELFDEIYSE